jgi:hypothetical protein
MEAHAIGELAARTDTIRPGLVVLTGLLTELADEVTGAEFAKASFDQIEQRVVQPGLGVHAAGEPGDTCRAGPQVSYRLAPLGTGLTESLQPFLDWIRQHTVKVVTAQRRHDSSTDSR